jgi:hypothetical protein
MLLVTRVVSKRVRAEPEFLLEKERSVSSSVSTMGGGGVGGGGVVKSRRDGAEITVPSTMVCRDHELDGHLFSSCPGHLRNKKGNHPGHHKTPITYS